MPRSGTLVAIAVLLFAGVTVWAGYAGRGATPQIDSPVRPEQGFSETFQVRGPDSAVLLTGADVDSMTLRQVRGGAYPVLVTFKPEGARKLADATGRLSGKSISVFQGKRPILSQLVGQPNTTGAIELDAGWSLESAQRFILDCIAQPKR